MTVTSILDLLDDEPAHSGAPGRANTLLPDGAPARPHDHVRPLRLSVVWGDLTRVPADIHLTGHYQGVAPASAEHALDRAISSARLLIREHTLRGWLVGALGEMTYFPGAVAAEGAAPIRRVAVAGMGRLGTFSELRATQLYTSLLDELTGLDGVREAATVLIGSGASNLTLPQACRALATGFGRALGRAASGDRRLDRVIVVEMDRLRAEQIRMLLERNARLGTSLVVDREVGQADGGSVGVDSAAVIAICALARLVRDQPTTRPGDPVDVLLRSVPANLRSVVREKLAAVSDDYTALSVLFGEPPSAAVGSPVRISVMSADGHLRWAALTERSTVPERLVPVSRDLLTQLAERLTAPNPKDAADLPRMLSRFVVPVDFQAHVTDQAALILEVDRTMARLPWEFLTDDPFDAGREAAPLAVRTCIARQLRTTHARVLGEHRDRSRLHALVIGDPGDRTKGQALAGARAEAKEVAAVLRDCGVDVRLFLGSPQPGEEAEPATQLDVLTELLGRDYDLVHYAGHGTFDAANPDLVGWLFGDGLLGARELAQLSSAPRLVVANACWSAARTAEDHASRAASADLTPVLADEFLRVGVVHYIGTSWQVPDQLARRFARLFYGCLLTSSPGRVRTVGEAVRRGREDLFFARVADPAAGREQWTAWAAYQHYGDPGDLLDPPGHRMEPAREEQRRDPHPVP